MQLQHATHTRVPLPNHGFTLMELAIVLAIVSVLLTMAYPSYADYIRQSHRANARAGLLQAAQWLERAATANGIYPVDSHTGHTYLPDALTWTNDHHKRYTIGFQTGNTNNHLAWTLTATPKTGPQATDQCGSLTLSQTGETAIINLPIDSQASKQVCWGH